ncbi:MAG: DNA helicase [Bacteroidetes bacterium B1(2017)]|nr:MAG: DNA helicase [Bacteroidetes bacterium B1(2017)]
MRDHPNEIILSNTLLYKLTKVDIIAISELNPDVNRQEYLELTPIKLELNSGVFTLQKSSISFPDVSITQVNDSLIVSCPCSSSKKKLCTHQSIVLQQIISKSYFKIFFDPILRKQKLLEFAKDFGLENELNLDEHFALFYESKGIIIKPIIAELQAVTANSNALLKSKLIKTSGSIEQITSIKNKSHLIIVFRKHKYYDQLNIELYECAKSKDGKPKNPLVLIDPISLVWNTEDIDVAKFYSALARYQNNYTINKTEHDLNGLKQIVANPLQLPVFMHVPSISESINAKSLEAIKLNAFETNIQVQVDQKAPFYEISGEFQLNSKWIPLRLVQIKFGVFVLFSDSLNLVTDTQLLKVLEYFKSNNEKILIHKSKFELFRLSVLDALEKRIQINYSFIKKATKKQESEHYFNQDIRRIIYLSEESDFISITPVVAYGNVEIPVYSRKQIYDVDPNGNEFLIDRNFELEDTFTGLILRQHKEFTEQLEMAQYFYLHRTKFLDSNWFLDAFEDWMKENILILGFNELKGNKLNAYKINISIDLVSGIDWFNAGIQVSYGKQKVALKKIHQALRNKSKFIALDDGSQGILPVEWIKKFEHYFALGEIRENELIFPKSNFGLIEELFEDKEISAQIKSELKEIKSRLSSFEKLTEVGLPKGFNGELRHYQQEGLNWLNFLDDYNFGGCLADDMGLGKTIQIIAFLLHQRVKHGHKTNLIVAPSSLIFNWELELKKFAPSLKVYTHFGSNRVKNKLEFETHEVVLTSYGMMLADIYFLKDFVFNYIFLDESQVIKNPNSQRYKAARILRARNRIVLTGTPIENNTLDIYGQLSFACPGLLGNKNYFTEIFAIPIDKFKNSKRAKELQQRIQAFVLRRTKKQVAKELPEKTEMILYCEMGEEQRRAYSYHEKELREYLAGKTNDEIKQTSMHVLTGITKLRQLCNSTALVKEEFSYGNYSSKIEVLMEQIENKSSQHKILVFSQFVGMLELIRTELDQKEISYEYLTGESKNREKIVTSFQNNPEIRVFLISLKAGGVGLNLTEADYIYLVDPWWNPAVENQAIDRSYRIGQTKHVIAVRLLTPDTLEEKIRVMQQGKKELVDDLIKTDSGFLNSLSKTDLLSMLDSTK